MTTRQCERCGLTLVRKRYPSGRLEEPLMFARRRTCGHICANRLPHPSPAPVLSFTAAYQAALAQGTDLLEVLDAAWEA